ncbi:MAG: chemotaxis-specific protein-glutamate methyltransferase CheB [Pseudomonadota bacterium]
MTDTSKLSVLVVDDAIVYRQVLTKVVGMTDFAHVTATAASGPLALKQIDKYAFDVVLLDIEMPEMNGVETLEHIRLREPDIPVIMVSGISREASRSILKCLELGALEFVPKPKANNIEDAIQKLYSALSPLLNMVMVRKYAQLSRSELKKDRQKTVPQPLIGPKRRPEIVVIGCSTGGPSALSEIMPNINSRLGVPVLIVQHMPPIFTLSLAEQLRKLSDVVVVEGSDGEIPKKNWIYIAPGGRHMIVRKNNDGPLLEIGIIDTLPVRNCRPSADVLFSSVAEHYGSRVLAVILTGMGDDGTNGVREIKQKGGYCIVQNKESSLIWGMPGSVNEAGLDDELIPLNNIAQRINTIMGA